MSPKNKKPNIKIKWDSSEDQLLRREKFFQLFKNCPIPDNELLLNLGLFAKRQDLSRILFMNELYKKVINVPGSIVEFGTRWGQNMALFESFRGIYEPFNHNRKIIGFDTFNGFPLISQKDKKSDIASVGGYATTEKYEEYLEKILSYHEQESPIPHNIKKYELVKGDAVVEIDKYLKRNPETIIALAYFDFDLYESTKKCLRAIDGHVTKGSIIGFDDLNVHAFPGETLALKEVWGLNKYKIIHSPYSTSQGYLIIE